MTADSPEVRSAPSNSVSFDVVVPSYKRTDTLINCLEALSKQTLPPKTVYVVLRDEDLSSHQAVAVSPLGDRAKVVPVYEPGLLAALNAGIEATTADLVALTDDDSVAEPAWLEKLATFYKDPKVVGVGGRDILPQPYERKSEVGTIDWRGRLVGNHHCGEGPAREVQVIKGVNCSYRGEWLRRVKIGRRLKGNGTQHGTELVLGCQAKVDGFKIIYDPDITVLHFPAVRHGEHQRDTVNVNFEAELMYNRMFAIAPMLSPAGRRVMLGSFRWVGSMRWPGVFWYPATILRFGKNEASQRRAAVKLVLDWLKKEPLPNS